MTTWNCSVVMETEDHRPLVVWIEDESKHQVARCEVFDPIHSDRLAAETRLIAAAPEMLEALRQADQLLCERGFGSAPGGVREVIRAALTKATGAQS